MKKTKISVYRYHDYRRCVNDWLRTLKSKGISLRAVSKELEVSAAYLSQVLKGKKDFSPSVLNRLSQLMKLDKYEKKHLLELVNLSKSQGRNQKIQVYDKIIKDKKYQNSHPDEHGAFTYLNHWYYVALREFLILQPECNNLKSIADKFIFKLKDSEIKKAIQFLVKEKFIEIKNDGTFEVLQKNVDCYDDIYRLSLASFHQQMFTLATESIYKVEREKRLILGNTIGVSKLGFEKIKNVIQDAHEKIKEIEQNDTEADTVMHVGFATFPLTKSR